jgi:hypothetical protein
MMTPAMVKLLEAKLRQALSAGERVIIPEAGALVWQWFCDLSAGRTWHMAGPNPIAYSEIEAYARLNRWPMRSDHVEAIRALDAVFIDHCSRRNAPAPEGVKTLPPVSDRPMSGELFDALFG